MVCGSSLPAIRFQRHEVLIAAHLSSSSLRKHYQSYSSNMKMGPEATRKPPRHFSSPHQSFYVLPDAPRPTWSFAKYSQTLQEHFQMLLKAPGVMEVPSG
jgi:hypothetical protein